MACAIPGLAGTIRWITFVLSTALVPAYAEAETILDPIGDSPSHDIISIDGTFDATTLFLTANFAPGTLNPANLAFIFGLDTDLDAGTGSICQGGIAFPCGAEWSIGFNSMRDPTNAILGSPISGTLFGTFPVSFNDDTLGIILPLDPDPMIGLPDDGLALFGLVVGVPFSDTGFTGIDFAPDSAFGGPLGGPTMPIPEPSTALLLGSGLASLSLRRRRGVA